MLRGRTSSLSSLVNSAPVWLRTNARTFDSSNSALMTRNARPTRWWRTAVCIMAARALPAFPSRSRIVDDPVDAHRTADRDLLGVVLAEAHTRDHRIDRRRGRVVVVTREAGEPAA